MSGPLYEIPVDCPFCGETITLLVDPSVAEQEYIEDCSVCCRPIQVRVRGDAVEVERGD